MFVGKVPRLRLTKESSRPLLGFSGGVEAMPPSPPVEPAHWWDFTDSSQVTMAGSEISALADKKGNADLSFAASERPERANGRAAIFDNGPRGSFDNNFMIDHRNHTIFYFGHFIGDGNNQGLLSGDSAFFVFGMNNATPKRPIYFSGSVRAATSVDLPQYSFAGTYNEAGVFGASALYGRGGASGALLGNSEDQDVLSALAASTSNSIWFGAWINGLNKSKARIMGAMYYDSELSNAEIDEILAWAKTYYGTYDDATQDRVIICDGDSLTTGFGPTFPALEAWPAQLGSSFNVAGARISNRALDGWTISDDTTGSRTTTSLTNYAAFTRKDVILWAGTNDVFVDGDSAATVNANIDTILSSITGHTTAPDNIYLCNIIHRGSDNANRATVNAHIASKDGSTSNGVPITTIDLAADAALSDASDTTYFNADAVHLTREGYAKVAERVSSVVLA